MDGKWEINVLEKIGNCMLKISDPGELIVYRYGGTSLVAVSLIHDYKE